MQFSNCMISFPHIGLGAVTASAGPARPAPTQKFFFPVGYDIIIQLDMHIEIDLASNARAR